MNNDVTTVETYDDDDAVMEAVEIAAETSHEMT